MADVRLSAVAVEDLERMILTHSLPADTKVRIARCLAPLSRFPLLGRELEGRWSPFRFVLGPWRWMLILYVHQEPEDVVLVVSIQDARSSSAVTSG